MSLLVPHLLNKRQDHPTSEESSTNSRETKIDKVEKKKEVRETGTILAREENFKKKSH